jgi:hypothetical protein
MFMWASNKVSRLSYRIEDFQEWYGRKYFGWTIRPFLEYPKWAEQRKQKRIQYFLVVDMLDPVRSFLRHRLPRRLAKPAYRFEKQHRYHLIDTKLAPGYYDIDTLVLHGSMALLERYVDEEMGGEQELTRFTNSLRDPANQDPNAPPGAMSSQADFQEVALELYKWWKYQEMLHKMVDIRGCLWT